jgi:GT2 family glycosyltransferase
VDVVIPFRGTDTELDALLDAVSVLQLEAGDSLVVVDNGPAGRSPRALGERRSVIVETGVASSYYARNRGAGRGDADWILFLDADVRPPGDLLDRYFDPPPAERDGVLAGAVVDEVVGYTGWRHPAVRFAHLKAAMSQDNTLDGGPWAYAQTANCAVRRAGFQAIGGFTEDVRSGGDADLCFRMRRAGWAMQARDAAAVVHRSRRTLRSILRQRARHGSGARWLNSVYPGAFPRELSLGTVRWSVSQAAGAAGAILRRDGDRAILLAVGVLWQWAFELGRLAPNHVRHRARRAR